MKKAIIMGAGPAGLTAAYELLTRTDITPIVIEMDTQPGGLSKTIRYKGNLIDIGGHRFFSKSEKITRWWLQFLTLESTPDTGIQLSYQNQTVSLEHSGPSNNSKGKMLVRPRKSRIYYNHSFFDYPLSFNKKTLQNFGFPKLFRMGVSYLSSKLFPVRQEKTLEDFFINRFGNELYQTFFKGYTEKIWGVPCREIPADWGHQRIKDLNIGKAIVQSVKSIFSSNTSIRQDGISTSLIEQFLYPEEGPGQMWETVAERIRELGGEIHLGHRIEKINAMEGNIRSVSAKNLVTNELTEWKGDYFFSTIPVQHLIASLDNIRIPPEVVSIASQLAYRDFIIVGLLFKKQGNNKKENIESLRDNWIYLQDKNLTAGRLQIFNNWSPKMVSDPNNIWLGLEYFCSEKDELWKKSNDEMIDFALQEIRQTGLIRQEILLDATVIKVPKAYPSYIGAYEKFDIIQQFTDAIGNLYLAGRNGMHRYNNTDHSMMTAMTAVDNIIKNEKDRSNIWAVNMEQDFHEDRSES